MKSGLEPVELTSLITTSATTSGDEAVPLTPSRLGASRKKNRLVECAVRVALVTLNHREGVTTVTDPQ